MTCGHPRWASAALDALDGRTTLSPRANRPRLSPSSSSSPSRIIAPRGRIAPSGRSSNGSWPGSPKSSPSSWSRSKMPCPPPPIRRSGRPRMRDRRWWRRRMSWARPACPRCASTKISCGWCSLVIRRRMSGSFSISSTWMNRSRSQPLRPTRCSRRCHRPGTPNRLMITFDACRNCPSHLVRPRTCSPRTELRFERERRRSPPSGLGITMTCSESGAQPRR